MAWLLLLDGAFVGTIRLACTGHADKSRWGSKVYCTNKTVVR